jgi:hypothetical protein
MLMYVLLLLLQRLKSELYKKKISIKFEYHLILTSFRSIDGFDKSEQACRIANTDRLNNN